MMLSISVLLICFCFFHLCSRNPSSLSVDYLNSKIYTICISSLIVTPSGCLPQKRFWKKDSSSRLYRASWLFLTGIVTSISCAFSASSSLLQILKKLFSSPQCAHVTFFVTRDRLELAFWLLCSVLAVIQVPLDGVVGSRNCHCHFFAAACNVSIMWPWCVRFSTPDVSAVTSGLSQYSAQPTPCWLRLSIAYFGQITGCWCIFNHHRPTGFFCQDHSKRKANTEIGNYFSIWIFAVCS